MRRPCESRERDGDTLSVANQCLTIMNEFNWEKREQLQFIMKARTHRVVPIALVPSTALLMLLIVVVLLSVGILSIALNTGGLWTGFP